ncbi:Hint domain-containing protein [Seohaeicola saemankumensis]|nr:Hint domain-containing protein [Seohaeicola saemankumensis]MCA0870590.1 Hint domain-containing protein [Seohaeicola saemankumensis]
MGWLGISDHDGQTLFGAVAAGGPDGLLARGSLVIEARIPTSREAMPLIYVHHDGDWPFHLSLQAIPGGGLTLVLDQGNGVVHQTMRTSDSGRSETLRLTYSWDAPARSGLLSVEQMDQTDQNVIVQHTVHAPGPLRLSDLRALLTDGPHRYLADEVSFVAASDMIEPVGPMPTLAPDTPVATPTGYRAVRQLSRGDLVMTSDGQAVPVLHRLTRSVPARGLFRPLRLRTPYFGLLQDIVVAPTQRLVLTGSDVEYMFGCESVLVEVRHLLGGTSVVAADSGPLTHYTQLLLPHHEAVIAAGGIAETLYIGRMRRRRDSLGTSILAGLDRHGLPEHAQSLYPVLNAFDAITLAGQRAA